MKKSFGHILLGVIIGVSISFSPQIYGASASLLGKDVDKQMEVKLNDKVIGNAAVIEGTSYIPVRAFANEYQLDVAVNTTTITLTSPSAEENAKAAHDQQAEAEASAEKYNKLNTEIISLKKDIQTAKDTVNGSINSIAELTKRKNIYDEKLKIATEQKNQMAINDFSSTVSSINADIAKINSDVETAKANLLIWEPKLADLEAQLAALQ